MGLPVSLLLSHADAITTCLVRSHRKDLVKCSTTFFSLTLALSLSACLGSPDFIEFEADTIVFPDSAVTRKTRFIVGIDARIKRDVETRYDLPAEGKWETGKRTWPKPGGGQYEGSTFTYETAKEYSPGTPMAPDYERKSMFSKQVSHNEPRLTVHNYIFVKTYDYEERFRDIVTPESIDKAMRKFYEDVVERGSGVLAQESKAGLTAKQASMAIRAVFDPMLDEIVNTFKKILASKSAPPESDKDLLDRLEPKRVAGQLIEVLPPPTGWDIDAWRKAIAKAYENARETALKENPSYDEEFFGNYGLNLFGPKYTFNLALSLPGALVETNASRQDGSRLTWEFKGHDFYLKDHVLRARSRLVFPERIAAAGAALVAIVTVIWFAWRRRRQSRKDFSQAGSD